jgi:hypothetical protein
MKTGVAGAEADTQFAQVVAAGNHDGVVAGMGDDQAVKLIVIATDGNAVGPRALAGTIHHRRFAGISP